MSFLDLVLLPWEVTHTHTHTHNTQHTITLGLHVDLGRISHTHLSFHIPHLGDSSLLGQIARSCRLVCPSPRYRAPTKSHGGSRGFNTHGPLQDLITSPAGHHTHALDLLSTRQNSCWLTITEVGEGGQCVSKRNAPSTHTGVEDQVVPSSTECTHAPIGNHSAGFDLPGSAIEIPHSPSNLSDGGALIATLPPCLRDPSFPHRYLPFSGAFRRDAFVS